MQGTAGKPGPDPNADHDDGIGLKIIEFIHANGSVKTRDLVAMFKISRQAALKELTVLLEKDLIQREGDQRGARYILK